MLALENVEKKYRTKDGSVVAIRDVHLSVRQGEFIVLCGPSGSGKTTLLMTIAAMLRPNEGIVRFEDRDLYAMPPRQRAKFRVKNIGFVFQMFHLVPYLNVAENVLLAAYNGDKTQHSRELLDRLGMTERVSHHPDQLSAGEKQRVAIARALLNDPRIILADEPTGNLDPDNAHVVLDHLSAFHRDGGTVILASHSERPRDYADRLIHLEGGTISG